MGNYSCKLLARVDELALSFNGVLSYFWGDGCIAKHFACEHELSPSPSHSHSRPRFLPPPLIKIQLDSIIMRNREDRRFG